MSINQLGRINFPDLHVYNWRADDFEALQVYLESYFKEFASGLWSDGIIYGGQVSVQAGLSLSISKLLAKFGGQLVTMEADTIDLDAADADHPRIDRIELELVQTNGTTVKNVIKEDKVLDKLFTGVLHVNKGVASIAPAAPATTAGRRSLGLISVAATQAALLASDIDQSDVARDLARRVDPSVRSALIANNQAAFAPIKDLRCNSTLGKVWRIWGNIFRQTDDASLVASASLIAIFRGGEWGLVKADIDGDDVGIEFDIDETSGQIELKSSDMAGDHYTGSLDFWTKV